MLSHARVCLPTTANDASSRRTQALLLLHRDKFEDQIHHPGPLSTTTAQMIVRLWQRTSAVQHGGAEPADGRDVPNATRQ